MRACQHTSSQLPRLLAHTPHYTAKALVPEEVTQLRDKADLGWAQDKPPGSSHGTWSTPHWSLAGLGLLAWNLAVCNSVGPFLPRSQPTRGLCPRLPESPSEGRGLQARQSQARPSETQPQTRAGHHCVSLPFHWLYLLRQRTQDSGATAPAVAITRPRESARMQPQGGGGRPTLGGNGPQVSLHFVNSGQETKVLF